MKKITEYAVVARDLCGDHIEEAFSNAVKKKIQEGWQPWGSMSMSECTDKDIGHFFYCVQPMVKFEE